MTDDDKPLAAEDDWLEFAPEIEQVFMGARPCKAPLILRWLCIWGGHDGVVRISRG